MRSDVLFGLVLSLGLTGTLAQSSGDLVDFPATGELAVVFPRNETYTVEAPFPVIFGFHNAPVLLSFPTILYWELSCGRGTLFGIGRFEGQRAIAPPSDPYFFLNASDTLTKADEGDQFEYFRGETDSCTLEWEFKYYTTCKRLPDGGLRIMGGYFGERKGNVTFTLRPGAKSPRHAIANYEGCAVAGTAVKVASNETGCAQIAEDAAPKPKPCDLDVEGTASSLAKAVVSPTTSLASLPSSTTEGGSTATGSGSASEATGGASGDGDSGSSGDSGNSGDDDGSLATPRFAVSGVLSLVVAVVTGGLIPFLL